VEDYESIPLFEYNGIEMTTVVYNILYKKHYAMVWTTTAMVKWMTLTIHPFRPINMEYVVDPLQVKLRRYEVSFFDS
jgi:hypothetical protein